jgi:hypothetical protein
VQLPLSFIPKGSLPKKNECLDTCTGPTKVFTVKLIVILVLVCLVILFITCPSPLRTPERIVSYPLNVFFACCWAQAWGPPDLDCSYILLRAVGGNASLASGGTSILFPYYWGVMAILFLLGCLHAGYAPNPLRFYEFREDQIIEFWTINGQPMHDNGNNFNENHINGNSENWNLDYDEYQNEGFHELQNVHVSFLLQNLISANTNDIVKYYDSQLKKGLAVRLNYIGSVTLDLGGVKTEKVIIYSANRNKNGIMIGKLNICEFSKIEEKDENNTATYFWQKRGPFISPYNDKKSSSNIEAIYQFVKPFGYDPKKAAAETEDYYKKQTVDGKPLSFTDYLANKYTIPSDPNRKSALSFDTTGATTGATTAPVENEHIVNPILVNPIGQSKTTKFPSDRLLLLKKVFQDSQNAL